MQNDKTVTTNEIMDFLKDHMVMKEEFHSKVASIHKEMATQEELKQEIGKLRSDIIDFIDKKIFDLRGDIVHMVKGEDKKFLSLLALLIKKQVITDQEGQIIFSMEPFPTQ